MSVSLTKELVLLCEGRADKAFFTTLLRERAGLPQFDIPFPESKAELDDGKEPLGGRDKFGEMLRAIRVSLAFRNVRGILIVADSADRPAATFNHICDQIKKAPGYTVPDALLAVSERTDDSPSIAVMLIPDERNPGGIETLYTQEITQTRTWLSACVEIFLSCGEIEAHGWAVEKKDKARFHSMVAALLEHDPSRPASMIWKRGAPLLMDIQSQCFDDVANRMLTFAKAVGDRD
jgi:hypothetical protein